MLRGVFIINTQGHPRLVKLYTKLCSQLDQQDLLNLIYKIISSRDASLCNFTDIEFNHNNNKSAEFNEWIRGTKLIYRHYATLYFVFACECDPDDHDMAESELGILDLIQVFVETLDKTFTNVCELDLIFHSDTVHYVLDEMVQGGLVLETNMAEILRCVHTADALEQESLNKKISVSSTH